MDLSHLKPICERLEGQLPSLPDPEVRWRLEKMLRALVDNHDWPDLKIGKWLGFVEACLIMHGVTDIDTERDFSRPLFHDHYRSVGIEPPASIDVTKE
tara:strand:+ start:53 stop:346 length:294 start_codon:yes stop_codon:yes gene_type:complete